MAEYLFANYGLPIFDAAGAVIILNFADQLVDQIGNVLSITTSNEFPNGGALPPRATPQPAIPIRFAAMV